MRTRVATLGTLAVLVLVLGTGMAWWLKAPPPALPDTAAADSDDGPLPVPPVPPRIAEGEEYERCLAMLPDDPSGAREMAETMLAHRGGEAATHCLALSHLEFGESQAGAEMLEQLAASSHAPDVARAAVYDQADQAWLMAGDAGRAFAAATLALTLSQDDPDLLVNRAIAAAALEQWADARDDVSRALDLDPKRTDALVLRGSAWRHMDHLAAAQDDIDRALSRDPDNTEALLERGILRQRGNDQAGARRDWERAISIDPDSNTADLAQQNLALLEAGPERK